MITGFRSTFAAVLAVSAGCWTAVAAEGVVVETVSPGQAAAAAGLRPGDRLTGWRHPEETDVAGRLETPFDLTAAEVTTPLAELVLDGRRAGAAMSWRMPGGRWGIESRVGFEGDEAAEYLAAVEAWEGDDHERALTGLRRLRDALAGDGRLGPAAWLAVRIAAVHASAQRWDAALRSLATIDTLAERGLPVEVHAAALELAAENFTRHADAAPARRLWERAIALRDGASGSPLARVLERLGAFEARRGQLDEAERRLDRAYALVEPLAPAGLLAAGIWNGRGTVAVARGDYDAAERAYLRALEILEPLAQSDGDAARPLGNLGTLAAMRGDLATAEQRYRRALEIKERTPDDRTIPQLLNNLGIVAKQRGDVVLAEHYYRRALEINERNRAWVSYSTNLFNLADVAQDREDYAAAELLLRRALENFRNQNPDGPAVAQTLTELAAVALDRDQPDEAEQLYEEAATLYRRVAPDSLDATFAVRGLGEVALARGDYETAAARFGEALERRAAAAPGSLSEAEVRHLLGETALAAGEPETAGAHLGRALAIQSRIAPGSIAEARTRHALARLALGRGDVGPALEHYEQAIAAVESQTRRLGGADDARSRFNDRYSIIFKEYIAALIELGEHARAFGVLERYRARSLLALIAERDLTLDADLPPALAAERRRVDHDYDRALAGLARLAEGGATEAELAAARERLGELRIRRDAIAERLRQASPRYGDLRYPQPLDLERARRSLGDGQAVLSYSVHADRTWLFVLSAGGLEVVALDVGEEALRDLVRRFRLLIDAGRDAQASDGRPAAALVETGARLFDMLVRPAAERSDAGRYLIVPDGPLHLLPFAALIDAGDGEAQGDAWRYLVETQPHHVVLSVTLHRRLGELSPRTPSAGGSFGPLQAPGSSGRSESPGERELPSESDSGPVTLVAFGDPAPPQDETLTAADRPPAVYRSLGRQAAALGPLPGAREEVEKIAALYAPDARIFLGAAATEEAAKAADAGYLHFATHSLIDPQMPLDSALVLSLVRDPRPGQENGLLQTWEIFESLRTDAELVVLSGCETGLGHELGGDGLIGLTRAFQHAGARAVLASLWRVSDASTASLMARFYESLKAGSSKEEALREAQLHLIRSDRDAGWITRVRRRIAGDERPPALSHPYHWAAFQLHGYAR